MISEPEKNQRPKFAFLLTIIFMSLQALELRDAPIKLKVPILFLTLLTYRVGCWAIAKRDEAKENKGIKIKTHPPASPPQPDIAPVKKVASKDAVEERIASVPVKPTEYAAAKSTDELIGIFAKAVIDKAIWAFDQFRITPKSPFRKGMTYDNARPAFLRRSIEYSLASTLPELGKALIDNKRAGEIASGMIASLISNIKGKLSLPEKQALTLTFLATHLVNKMKEGGDFSEVDLSDDGLGVFMEFIVPEHAKYKKEECAEVIRLELIFSTTAKSLNIDGFIKRLQDLSTAA